MSYDYNDDSLALHTDLYQINMMKTYWDEGITEKHAIFVYRQINHSSTAM